MIFMGEAQLADGFRLIGFETWADPSFDEVEKLVRDLIVRRQNVFFGGRPENCRCRTSFYHES
jgi:vacuolar-type H+-ATPase subunit F/Vma7